MKVNREYNTFAMQFGWGMSRGTDPKIINNDKRIDKRTKKYGNLRRGPSWQGTTYKTKKV